MMGDMDDPKRPPRRFMERYERRRAAPHGRFVRPVRVAAGVVLIILGVAIGWLPGPGFIIFALPGSFLLASEVRRAASLLDRVEAEALPRLQRLRARARGGPKQAWVDAAPEGWARWCEDRRRMELPDSGERRRSSDMVASSGPEGSDGSPVHPTPPAELRVSPPSM